MSTNAEPLSVFNMRNKNEVTHYHRATKSFIDEKVRGLRFPVENDID